MNKKLSVGDKVKIHSGEYEGQYGIVVYIGTNGGVEVHVGCADGVPIYCDLWDFQLEKVKDVNEITQEVKEEQSESKGEDTMNQNNNDNLIKDSGERFSYVPWSVLLDIKEKYDKRKMDASVDEVMEVINALDLETFIKVRRIIGELKSIF